MADEIKFTDEELKSLSELSQGYQNIQTGFGQLRVQKILLEQQGEALEEADKGDMDNDGVSEPDDEEYMDNKDKAIKKAMKDESLDHD